MSGIGGERNQDQKNIAALRVKLRRAQNDHRFEEIKKGRHRRAPALKNFVGNITREQRTGGGHKWNRGTQATEIGRLKIDVMHLLHETRKPLVDALPHRAGAGIGAGDYPDDGICQDRLKHDADLRPDVPTAVSSGLPDSGILLLPGVFDETGPKRDQRPCPPEPRKAIANAAAESETVRKKQTPPAAPARVC